MNGFPYGGYAGKLLRVDLTTRTVQDEPLRADWAEKFLGGRGLGARLLFAEVGPEVDPLQPDNKIIITNGPLTGTGTPGSARHVTHTKSPLTGIYLNCVSGGHFGHQLKLAGYDSLIISGKADRPVYLWISDGKAEIKEASFVWGMDCERTQEFIKKDIDEPRASVACIGPAGERKVMMAAVMNERRASARGGVGAVFGAKNLKAIAVHGTTEPRLADAASFAKALEDLKKLHDRAAPVGVFTGYGSATLIHNISKVGGFPTRNWQTGVLEGVEKIFPETWAGKYRIGSKACPGCPVSCGHVVVVTEGPYAGAMTEGPEYETLYSLGGAVGNTCAEAIIAGDEICDRFGLDTIEAGIAIAFAMECYQRGILTKEDTGGLELTWGNHEVMIELLKQMAFKRDFGAFVSQGVKRMSNELGQNTAGFAMQVKGLAMGGYDPRAVKGIGIGMAHAARGGCHHNATYTMYEETEFPGANPLATEGKPKLLADLIHGRMSLDLIPICIFHWPIIRHFPVQPQLISSATGMKMTAAKFYEIGERVHNLERAYNVRMGYTRKDDRLPERLLKEAMPEGPAKGETWPMDLLLDGFYEVCGWDKRSGVPTRQKLDSLGLEDVAGELSRLGRLP